jgi:hypothetical protein
VPGSLCREAIEFLRGALAVRLFQSVRLVFPGRVKPQLSCEGCRGLIRRIPTRFYSVLYAIQYQGCRDSTGQPTATKLTVGLNLDLQFPPPTAAEEAPETNVP